MSSIRRDRPILVNGFNRLTEFVQSIGKPDWTAQKLREQYILKHMDEGKSLDQIAKQLGLKTSMSLEKFR